SSFSAVCSFSMISTIASTGIESWAAFWARIYSEIHCFIRGGMMASKVAIVRTNLGPDGAGQGSRILTLDRQLWHDSFSMRVFCFLALLSLLVRPQSSGAAEGMLSYIASDGGYTFGTSGWTFQPLTPISVTSLGVFDYILNPSAQNQSPMSVGL